MWDQFLQADVLNDTISFPEDFAQYRRFSVTGHNDIHDWVGRTGDLIEFEGNYIPCHPGVRLAEALRERIARPVFGVAFFQNPTFRHAEHQWSSPSKQPPQKWQSLG